MSAHDRDQRVYEQTIDGAREAIHRVHLAHRTVPMDALRLHASGDTICALERAIADMDRRKGLLNAFTHAHVTEEIARGNTPSVRVLGVQWVRDDALDLGQVRVHVETPAEYVTRNALRPTLRA